MCFIVNAEPSAATIKRKSALCVAAEFATVAQTSKMGSVSTATMHLLSLRLAVFAEEQRPILTASARIVKSRWRLSLTLKASHAGALAEPVGSTILKGEL